MFNRLIAAINRPGMMPVRAGRYLINDCHTRQPAAVTSILGDTKLDTRSIRSDIGSQYYASEVSEPVASVQLKFSPVCLCSPPRHVYRGRIVNKRGNEGSSRERPVDETPNTFCLTAQLPLIFHSYPIETMSQTRQEPWWHCRRGPWGCELPSKGYPAPRARFLSLHRYNTISIQ